LRQTECDRVSRHESLRVEGDDRQLKRLGNLGISPSGADSCAVRVQVYTLSRAAGSERLKTIGSFVLRREFVLLQKSSLLEHG
jgi:hypothetical protein